MNEERTDLKGKLEALRKKAESTFIGRRSADRQPADPPARRPAVPGAGDILKILTGEERLPLPSASGEGRAMAGRIEELVPGVPVRTGGSAFYRIFSDLDSIWKNSGQIHDEYLEALAEGEIAGIRPLKPLSSLQAVDPGEICYLDIETTGLSNAPLFLVGLMYSEHGRLMQDLLFARDYTEEKGVLGFLSRFIPRFSVLVTFNGERFDLPFINERMASESISFDRPAVHVDLLPVSRRLLGKSTPNHRLQTLEKYVLGRRRAGDIPGARIPEAYHDYVRSGDAGLIASVIHHNRLDLLSMLELVTVYISRSRAALNGSRSGGASLTG